MTAGTGVKRNYSLIGRILCKVHPDVALHLETVVRPGEETDLKKIFTYFARFDGLDLPGYKPVHKRRLFLAVMLQIYFPHYFTSDVYILGQGFVRNIAACFGCNKSHISRNIKEALVMFQAYEDFQQKVEEVSQYLKIKP